MAEKSSASVYIGNLDDRVSERVLYDILIQAGPVVDLHVPRDRETDKPKGYAFAEYESEEVANYAVKLFSGLVTLYRRTLKFGIAGQDKASSGLPNTASLTLDSSLKPRQYHGAPSCNGITSRTSRSSSSGFSEQRKSQLEDLDTPMHEPHGFKSSYHEDSYSRRAFGAVNDAGRSRSRYYDHDSSRYKPY